MKLGYPMRVLDVEFQFDNHKLTLYFKSGQSLKNKLIITKNVNTKKQNIINNNDLNLNSNNVQRHVLCLKTW